MTMMTIAMMMMLMGMVMIQLSKLPLELFTNVAMAIGRLKLYGSCDDGGNVYDSDCLGIGDYGKGFDIDHAPSRGI